MKNKLTITIKTSSGIEEALIQELTELGYGEIVSLKRAVQIQGTWRDVYYLNLHLRTALSILVELTSFRFKTKEELYEQTKKVCWSDYFSEKKTLAIKGAVFSELFPNTKYPLLLIKDAVVDQFREACGDRPNIELKNPQVVVDVHISNQQCTLSLNTSGTPLFQRGYRTETGEAPLNEVVAAGLIILSGWDKKSPFFDPFCGSGTLAIEAALMASGIPANIERAHYAFKNLKNFDAAVWNEIYDAAPKRPVKLDFPIVASDADQLMVTKAKRNIRALPVSRAVTFQISDFQQMKKPAEQGVLICNPPYGERMGEEVEQLYAELSDWFKNEMTGWECWVISSNEEAFKELALRPSRKMKVFNGNLECSFRNYSIYAGSKKRKEEGNGDG